MGFEVSVNDDDRQYYVNFKTVLEMREGESSVHVLLKVLALSIFHNEGIIVEPVDVDQQYRPDLLIKDISGFPKLWIECGAVTTSKLDKITSRYPDADFVVVKRYPREVDNLYERVEKEVRRPFNLSYVSFEPDFVDTLSKLVHGKNTVVAILSGDDFQIVLNGNHYETSLYRRNHPKPTYRG